MLEFSAGSRLFEIKPPQQSAMSSPREGDWVKRGIFLMSDCLHMFPAHSPLLSIILTVLMRL